MGPEELVSHPNGPADGDQVDKNPHQGRQQLRRADRNRIAGVRGVSTHLDHAGLDPLAIRRANLAGSLLLWVWSRVGEQSTGSEDVPNRMALQY